jgi:HD-GYP domain-containing protein (c-di-GMP phosphodiesterase class II)
MPREEIRSDRSASQAGSELFNTLQEMSRDLMTRATAEVELSLKLSKKLTAAHSVPDAVAAYQEWLSEEMGARAEDTRLLMSNGQKFMDTTSRFLSSGWTNAGMST